MSGPHSRPNCWIKLDQMGYIGSSVMTMTMPKKTQEIIEECADSHLSACEIAHSCNQYFMKKMASTQVDILHR